MTLHGYTIPAGSQVVPLLHAVHMDPELWDEPEEFRPSRFLSAEGKVQKPEYFMPFGVGRRMCLGDVLARMELFLFFSSLMHTFELRSPQGSSLPSLRGNAGVTVTPDPFDVCLVPRNLDLIEDTSNDAIGSGAILRNVGSHWVSWFLERSNNDRRSTVIVPNETDTETWLDLARLHSNPIQIRVSSS